MIPTAASSRCTRTSCSASTTTSSRRSSRPTRSARASRSTPTSRPRTGRRSSPPTRPRSKEVSGSPFPQEPKDQLWGAIGAVFGSWMNPRANTYRRLQRHPGLVGHRRQRAVDGVRQHGRYVGDRRRLHAQPVDRRAGALRRVPDQRAGRGRRRRHPHAAEHHRGRRAIEAGSDKPSMETALPAVFEEFKRTTYLLERHYRDMQDMEFTVEDGKLWMLQTRSGKRTARASIRIAVDMANDGLITRDEAIQRVDPAALDQLLHPTIDPDAGAQRGRDRPAGVARRGVRRDRLQLRGRGDREGGRQGGDPRARRDEPRRHPRHARRRGHPHHARRHDLARGRRRARHGQALRVGRRHDPRRLQGGDDDVRRRHLQEGRHDHRRRRHRPGAAGRDRDAEAGTLWRVRRR